MADARSADEQRAEADASARAGGVIEKARSLFQGGERVGAIKGLQAFEDAAGVAGALEVLVAAAEAIDSAQAAVKVGSGAERDAALERLESFGDRALIDAPLSSLRQEALERSDAEALEAAADLAIREAGDTFWRGDRDAAIAQLRTLCPARPRSTRLFRN